MKLKQRIARISVAALAATTTFALVGLPAIAATDVTPGVDATVTVDETTDVTLSDDGVGQLVCNPELSDYRIGYQGNLDMANVWSAWALLRDQAVALIGPERFNALQLKGEFTTSFTVDPAYVMLHGEHFTLEAWQARYKAMNSDTEFPEFMPAVDVDFDPATGTFKVTYRLRDGDVDLVSAQRVHENRPPLLKFPTAEGALTVGQDKFTAGESFDLTDPEVTGSITIPAYADRIPQLPINFKGTGEPVTIRMVDDGYFASYQYMTPDGTAIPDEVAATLPESGDKGSEEAMTQAPDYPAVGTEITVDGEIWAFETWGDPTVGACNNYTHIGWWSHRPATVNVSYSFVSGTDGQTLPAEVTDLLPAAGTAAVGEDVTPTAPSSSTVSVEGGTWTFTGWEPGSASEVREDVAFVGTWTFEAKAQPEPTPDPTTTPEPTPSTPAPSPAPTTPAGPSLPTTGVDGGHVGLVAILLLGAGAALLSMTRLRRS